MMFMTIGSAVIAGEYFYNDEFYSTNVILSFGLGNAIGTVTGLYRGISNTNELKGNIRRSA